MYQILLSILQKLASDLMLFLLRGWITWTKGHIHRKVEMTDYECALNYVLDREGGLVENVDDPGGITNQGISFRFLKSISGDRLKLYGIYDEVSEQTIKDLTKTQVYAVYKGEYWDVIPFLDITDIELRNYVFDTSVNLSLAVAIKCLQRALCAVYGSRKAVSEDGILGAAMAQILALLDHRTEDTLCAMRSERAGEYRLIAATCPDKRKFLDGWLNRAYEA
jgi:lysozyme family protein